MRIAHEHRRDDISDRSVSDSAMKQVIYWIIVFLALASIVCIGMIAIHWSMNL
jgi:hypothetical protein